MGQRNFILLGTWILALVGCAEVSSQRSDKAPANSTTAVSLSEHAPQAAFNDLQLGKLTNGKHRMITATPDGRIAVSRRRYAHQHNGQPYADRDSVYYGTENQALESHHATILSGDLYLFPQMLSAGGHRDMDSLFGNRFFLQYPGSITYNPDHDHLCGLLAGHNSPHGDRYSDPNCQSEYELKYAASAYGTISFDTRFGPNAFPVLNASQCVNPNITMGQIAKSNRGSYLCYKMIFMAPFLIGPKRGFTGPNFKRNYQIKLSIALQIKRNGQKINPKIVQARFHGSYEMQKATQSWRGLRTGISGLEVSATSDGRLITWKESDQFPADQPSHAQLSPSVPFSFFSYNPTPSNPRSWSKPVLFSQLHQELGNRMTCKLPQTIDDCHDNNKIKLRDLYKLAAKPFRDSMGDLITNNGGIDGTYFLCSYAWMMFDGSHVICNAPTGSVGLYQGQFIVGQHTNWSLRMIDAAANGFHFMASEFKGRNVLGQRVCVDETESNCNKWKSLTPIGLHVNKLLRMPVALGTDEGFWKSFPSGKPQNFKQTRRSPSIQILIRNDSLEFFNPIQEKLTNNRHEMNSHVYTDIPLDTGADKSFIAYFPMAKATQLSQNSSGAVSTGHRIVKTFTPSFTDEFYSGALIDDALLEREYMLRNNWPPQSGTNNPKQIFSVDGFSGQGAYFKKDSFISVKERNSGKLTSPLTELSVQLAVKIIRPNFQSGNEIKLLEWRNALVLTLHESGFIYAYIKSRNSMNANWRNWAKIRSKTKYRPGTDNGKFNHIGFTYKTENGEATGKLFINGRRDNHRTFSGGVVRPTANTSDVALFIGPNGLCSGCGNDYALVIDEVALLNRAKSHQHFATFAGLRDFTTGDNSAYPYPLPYNFSAKDMHLPPQLKHYLNTEQKYRQAARIGRDLFASPILSTFDNSGNNHQISCQTCHLPGQAFGDGLTTSSGVHGQDVGLNSPTLVNRIFGVDQFFDERAGDLFEQVGAPVTNPLEMGGKLHSVMFAVRNSNFAERLQSVFGVDSPAEVGFHHVKVTLAAFISSIRSGMNVDHKAVTDAKFDRGLVIFNTKGRCASCHNGANFSDDQRHRNHLRAVKTPTLWNIGATAPYFHDGSRPTLESVINFYVNPPKGDDNDPELRPISISVSEREDLLHFLRQLNPTVQFEGKK